MPPGTCRRARVEVVRRPHAPTARPLPPAGKVLTPRTQANIERSSSGVEMRHLSRGMHTGIGSAGADDLHRHAGKLLQGCLAAHPGRSRRPACVCQPRKLLPSYSIARAIRIAHALPEIEERHEAAQQQGDDQVVARPPSGRSASSNTSPALPLAGSSSSTRQSRGRGIVSTKFRTSSRRTTPRSVSTPQCRSGASRRCSGGQQIGSRHPLTQHGDRHQHQQQASAMRFRHRSAPRDWAPAVPPRPVHRCRPRRG
jgi:hypothetical protein